MSDPIVLVTGASGLLGQAFMRQVQDDYEVLGFDVVEAPDDSPAAVRHLDVTSDMSVRDGLERVRDERGDELAAVVHLAAYYDFSGDDSPRYDRITVQGTRRLLEHLEGFELERFVFTSTMLVHEAVKPGQRIDEGSPLEANWPYPESKIETERLIVDHTPPVPHTLLRLAGVYTDWGTQPTLAEQIRRIFEQDLKGFFFPGDSSAGQSILHLDDAVDALARTVDRRRELEDGPILVGEPEPMGYAELQDRIGELLWGTEWPTIRVPEPAAKAAAWAEDRVTDAFIKPYMIEMADDHYALDIRRAREWLGWEPEHRLANELETIVGRLEEDPMRWYRENGLEISDEVIVESLGTGSG